MNGWSSPAEARIAELVRERAGLTFSAERRGEVEAAIRRAARRRGHADAAGLAASLDNDTAAREELVAELTIGETYFLRDRQQFDLLRRELVPRLLAGRAADRCVRAWSAGCASGEEPYSLAMLFADADAATQVEVFGTDIARKRLEDARRAIYSRWSLRGVDESVVRRWFTPRGRYYELDRALRERVDFRYLNLAEDAFPSLSTGIWGMDLVLCRNVLIYFDRPTVARVARRLLDSLSETGWLLLGASDPPLTELVECDVVITDAGLAYRRPGAGSDGVGPATTALPGSAWPGATWETDASGEPGAAHAAADAYASADMSVADVQGNAADVHAPDAHAADVHAADVHKADVHEADVHADAAPADDLHQAEAHADRALQRAWQRRDFDAVRVEARALVSAGEAGEVVWVCWLRALANQGALQEAGEVAARALEAHPHSAELMYLSAVLQLQAGRSAAAAALARRALYLDRTLVVAHLALADAHQRSGDIPGALRSLRNAALQLSRMPAEAAVPASDGESAGRMAELVRVRARLLGEAA
jgi:chemotaxis protein methyltransferase CheR